MTKHIISEIATAFLVLLFIYTGSTKILEHHSFQVQLSLSPLLKPASEIISWVLPIVEITFATFLIFSRTKLIGLLSLAILLFCFILYLIYMVNNYKDLPCTCGGIINKMSWKQHIYFNIFSLLTSVLLIVDLLKSNNSKSKHLSVKYESNI
jgi:uncharacterized membrane protein YphA (DoxX/SURF4 family)